MTIKTWALQFYPTPASSDHTRLEAAEHALLKWSGLNEVALKQHGVEKVRGADRLVCSDTNDTFWLDERTCSLCKISAPTCADCAVTTVKGGIACSGEYVAYRDKNDVRPMLHLLKQVVIRESVEDATTMRARGAQDIRVATSLIARIVELSDANNKVRLQYTAKRGATLSVQVRGYPSPSILPIPMCSTADSNKKACDTCHYVKTHGKPCSLANRNTRRRTLRSLTDAICSTISSVDSWKQQFYPIPATDASAWTVIEAIDHSIRKWEGATPESLLAHGCELKTTMIGQLPVIVGVTSRDTGEVVYFDSDSCSLCVRGHDAVAHNQQLDACGNCPIRVSLGGRTCVELASGPYREFCRTGNPQLMLDALRDARRYQESLSRLAQRYRSVASVGNIVNLMIKANPLQSPITVATATVLCLQTWFKKCTGRGVDTETSISLWLSQLSAGERKTAVQQLCAMCASSVGHAFDAEEVCGDVTP